VAKNDDPPTGKIQRASFRLQLIAAFVAIGVLGWSVISTTSAVEKSNKLLETAQKTLEAQTRPPFLIIELQPEKSGNGFDDVNMKYFASGPIAERPDSIRINIWNTGAQVAENVTVSVTFEPHNGNLVDAHTMKKCRDIVCAISPEGQANSVKMRAIEAGGFYTVLANFTLYPQEIAKLEQPFYMTIQVDNPMGDQKIIQRYVVDNRL
jgi:hypothetical protein